MTTSSFPGSLVIGIDGPAGSGKSTVARAVARALGWRYVDTGASYRAATLAVLDAGVAPTDTDRVAELVERLVTRGGLRLGTDPERPDVSLDGVDVTAAVRGPEVTAAVSAVSAIPAVRAALVGLQRRAMSSRGAVAEGRDVGSAVAPDAVLKIYLDADPDIRAGRRAADADAGIAAAPSAGPPAMGTALVEAVAADLARRDAYDSSRRASPLRAAPDAVHIDASALSASEVVARVLALAARAGLPA